MTPDDFVRAITPDEIQPDKLDLDKYNKVRLEDLGKFLANQTSRSTTVKDSVFAKISKNGLISFSDYIFLLTVLSTSERHWQILFKVFDQNGDGEVDREEFRTVMKLAQKGTPIGERHRDTGSSVAKDILNQNSAICGYFYADEHHKLKLEQFLAFHRKLKSDILRIQFDKQNPNKQDKISKMAFAKMLLAYIERTESSFEELNRIKTLLDEPFRRCSGVTFEQVESLFLVLSYVEDIEMALDMHTSAGIELGKETFKHVAKVVANQEIDETVLNVMWAVFDVDGSGGLSNKEFLKTIKSRVSFGLDKPKDTGFWRLINAVYGCSAEFIKKSLFS